MDLQTVNEQTHILVAAGHRIFQIHRFGANEKEHVSRLLKWADFPQSSRICDMGCGTGEVARLMHKERDDLEFVLVNISDVQLEYAPEEMKSHVSDFCDVPEEDCSFDAVMFNFSIGHSDIGKAIKEAYRLLKNDGVLFIYDMARVSGSNEAMRPVEYIVNSRNVMEQMAIESNFALDFYLEPKDRGNYGRNLLGDCFDEVFSGTIPAIWRFIKNENP